MASENYNDIIELIEGRISARVSEQIAQFAKNLAERYRMNIHDVLTCYPGYSGASQQPAMPAGVKRCQGVCGTGRKQRQCSRNARRGESYCGTHLHQGEAMKLKAPAQIVHDGHTHPASVLFQEGCPKCMSQRRTPQQQVIDLGLLC